MIRPFQPPHPLVAWLQSHRGLHALSATSTLALLFATVALPAITIAQQPAATAVHRLTLQEALGLASNSSETVAIAKAGVVRAHGQQYQARSALFPQLSASANYQKTLQNQFAALGKRASKNSGNGDNSGSDSSLTNNPLATIFASPYTTTLSITGQQSLFSGGRNQANIKAAAAGREAAEIGVSSADAQLAMDVTQAYFDAILSDSLVAIAESALLQTERTFRQVQLSQQVGSTSEFEMLRARVTRDNQRPQYLQARTARDLAYVHLKQLLNLPLTENLVLTDEQQLAMIDEFSNNRNAGPELPKPAPSLNVTLSDVVNTDPRIQEAVNRVVSSSDTGVTSRAPVRQATAAVEVAKQQLRASRAQRLPSIGLSTTYQRLAYPANGIPKSLGDFYPNWTVGFGVTFPFFTGGRVRGELMVAEAGVTEAQQRLQQAKEGASLDTRQAIDQLREAQESWVASLGTSEQAARAYSIAEVRYKEGISTQVELSESRVQLQQAQANRARAARDLQVARVRLKLLRDLPLGGTAGASAPASGAAGSSGSPARSTQSAGPSGGPSGSLTQPGGNTP